MRPRFVTLVGATATESTPWPILSTVTCGLHLRNAWAVPFLTPSACKGLGISSGGFRLCRAEAAAPPASVNSRIGSKQIVNENCRDIEQAGLRSAKPFMYEYDRQADSAAHLCTFLLTCDSAAVARTACAGEMIMAATCCRKLIGPREAGEPQHNCHDNEDARRLRQMGSLAPGNVMGTVASDAEHSDYSASPGRKLQEPLGLFMDKLAVHT